MEEQVGPGGAELQSGVLGTVPKPTGSPQRRVPAPGASTRRIRGASRKSTCTARRSGRLRSSASWQATELAPVIAGGDWRSGNGRRAPRKVRNLTVGKRSSSSARRHARVVGHIEVDVRPGLRRIASMGAAASTAAKGRHEDAILGFGRGGRAAAGARRRNDRFCELPGLLGVWITAMNRSAREGQAEPLLDPAPRRGPERRRPLGSASTFDRLRQGRRIAGRDEQTGDAVLDDPEIEKDGVDTNGAPQPSPQRPAATCRGLVPRRQEEDIGRLVEPVAASRHRPPTGRARVVPSPRVGVRGDSRGV